MLAIRCMMCYAVVGATSTPVGGSPSILFGGDILLLPLIVKRGGGASRSESNLTIAGGNRSLIYGSHGYMGRNFPVLYAHCRCH